MIEKAQIIGCIYKYSNYFVFIFSVEQMDIYFGHCLLWGNNLNIKLCIL